MEKLAKWMKNKIKKRDSKKDIDLDLIMVKC